jgi:hypothetical protein
VRRCIGQCSASAEAEHFMKSDPLAHRWRKKFDLRRGQIFKSRDALM